jgi:hypothetical protein
MRSIVLGFFALTLASALQPAEAADCEGWFWQKIECLQQRVATLEQRNLALEKELRDMPQRFAAQLRALETRLNKRIDLDVDDVDKRVDVALKRGVRVRNAKEDTCLFSDAAGVGGFRRCENTSPEIWNLQALQKPSQ